jgi:uncharacterized protein (TIGR04255 family)
MPFAPIHEDNAIERIIFVAISDTPLSRQAVERSSLRKRLRQELPAASNAQLIEQTQNADGTVTNHAFDGIEFSFVRPDATPIWTLRILGRQVIVECTRYTRWDKIWPRARGYIADALTLTLQAKKDAKLISFQISYQDRFHPNSDEIDYTTLLKSSPFLSSFLKESGRMWHQHLGWFDSFEQTAVLNNLNIDVQSSNLEEWKTQGRGNISVSISHLQELKAASTDVEAFISSQSVNIDAVANRMRIRNKEIMESLLVEEMQGQISLYAPLESI